MKEPNLVTLNIGEHAHKQGPHDGQAAVQINGVPIKHLLGVKIECSAEDGGSFTKVSLCFYAEVNGQMLVKDDAFVFGGPEILKEKA